MRYKNKYLVFHNLYFIIDERKILCYINYVVRNSCFLNTYFLYLAAVSIRPNMQICE